MPDKEKNILALSIRLHSDLASKVRESCEKNGRSLNQEIENLLKLGLEESARRDAVIEHYKQAMNPGSQFLDSHFGKHQ